MTSSGPSIRRAPSDKPLSEEEAQQRFERLVKSALNTPPKPLKSMTPKRKPSQFNNHAKTRGPKA